MPTVITENGTIAFAVQAWLAVWIEQYSLRQWQRVLSAMWSSWLRAFKVVPCSYRRTTSFLKEGMYSFGMIVLPLYPIRKSFQVNTRYSDNTAVFPLQRRTTKQEVKKQESERSAFCFSILARRPSARTALSISRAFPHPNGRLHM